VIAAARKLHTELLAGNKPSLEELKNTVKKYMAEFEALTAAAKEDLKKHFPILTSIFTNEKAKALMDKHLQN
ncbi:nematode fatty acid retinoid binding protein, partial [Ancylostoma duodenale]